MQHPIINQPENVRGTTLLESCNDTYAIVIAEEIRLQRLAGLPTHHLDEKLNKEMTRLFAATRVLNGKPSHLVVNRPYYRNQ